MKDFKDENVLDEMLDNDIRQALKEKAHWQGDTRDMYNRINNKLHIEKTSSWHKRRFWIPSIAAVVLAAFILTVGYFGDTYDKRIELGNNDNPGKNKDIQYGYGASPIVKVGSTEENTIIIEFFPKALEEWENTKTDTEFTGNTEVITIGPKAPAIEIYQLNSKGTKGKKLRRITQTNLVGKAISANEGLSQTLEIVPSLKSGKYIVVYSLEYRAGDEIRKVTSNSVVDMANK